MNDRSVRMVMFGALLAALVACGSNSQPAKPQSEATGTQFASADDLGKWLSSNGFGCTRDDRLGGVYVYVCRGNRLMAIPVLQRRNSLETSGLVQVWPRRQERPEHRRSDVGAVLGPRR